ncbi:MAG: zinc ribbon domain-containing protein [Chloroflexi bacterium]|nr:zinc ribbon domain-containing protein [Chloroflexota bacterium]
MDLTNVLLGCLAGLGAMLAAFWLALIIWTFRDMRARSRDIFAQILAALLVAVLFLPGWVIYWMLRPKETLAEAYERSLEEEALLQGIEEVLACPGCGTRVQGEFVVCPNCHTKLKKSCQNCGRAMNLRWGVCPFCGTPSLGGVQLQSQPQQPMLSAGDTTIAAPAVRRAQRTPLPEPEPIETLEPPPSEAQADAS